MRNSSLTTGGRYILALCVAMIFPGTAFSVTISGSATFLGDKPPVKEIKMFGDATCMEGNSSGSGHKAPLEESLLVNGNREIQNVFVYLKKVDGEFPTPEQEVVLDQAGCAFKPHMVAIMTGQKLKIMNSDPTMHNVHSFSKVNRSFNRGQPSNAAPMESVMKKPEIGIKIKCDVHPWMSAYVHVLDHPFFSITNAKGEFKIENVPPGEYTLVAWHEKLGTLEGDISPDGMDLSGLQFKFKPKAAALWLK